MKLQETTLKTNPDLLKAYVILFKEFKTAKNQFMATNMLNKIQDCLVEDGYTLKEVVKFYKTNLNGYIKITTKKGSN